MGRIVIFRLFKLLIKVRQDISEFLTANPFQYIV